MTLQSWRLGEEASRKRPRGAKVGEHGGSESGGGNGGGEDDDGGVMMDAMSCLLGCGMKTMFECRQNCVEFSEFVFYLPKDRKSVV